MSAPTITPATAARRPRPLDPRSLAWQILLIVPALVLLVVAVRTAYGPREFYDFHIFWHAGRDVLAGKTPYPHATLTALRHQDQFVYPAPAAVAMAPLALLPLPAAASVFMCLNLIAVPLALWLLGVRDWRCHALTMCSIATLQGIVMGQLSPLLLLAAAVAWRWRDRRRAALAVAAAVAVKLFLAPLIVWLWATGRRSTAALAAGLAAAAMAIGWAAIGLKGLTGYPHLLSAVSAIEQRFGYSAVALGSSVGLPASVARGTALVVTAALCAAAWTVARRPGGDRRAFSLAVVATLTLSPIVWLSYFVLLAAPLALARPRLSPAWLLIVAPWAFANPNSLAPTWKIAAWTACAAAITWIATRASSPSGLVADTGSGA
jgi:alpha-1,2-mannosyltransferase